MKRLLCWLLSHTPPPGYTKARALYFICDRCGERARGEMAAGR